MPLPKPSTGEGEQDFIGRCMEDLKGEFPDNDQRLAVCGQQWRDGVVKKEVSLVGTIEKVDEDQRLVFGWVSIVEKGGAPIVDHQDEVIPEDELEKAQYRFVLHKRDAGEMHHSTGRGELVESAALTKEKQRVMQESLRAQGIDATVDLKCSAAWMGFRLDPELFAKVKSGKYPEFSIGGRALATEL